MMLKITYPALLLLISLVWLLSRAAQWLRQKSIRPVHELKLLMVYICIIVAARFTFFPFSKVDGQIQPLVFDAARMLPPRLNFVPFVHLFDYEIRSEALLNLIGNTAMFLPMGIIWPIAFPVLRTSGRAMAAGAGLSLCIEICQLPFFDRVSDVDDLILNTLGFAAGYGIYRLAGHIRRSGK